MFTFRDDVRRSSLLYRSGILFKVPFYESLYFEGSCSQIAATMFISFGMPLPSATITAPTALEINK